MVSELRELVADRFRKELKNELPEFEHIDTPEIFTSDSQVYVWSLKQRLSFFIRLILNPKPWEQSFMIEIGWNVEKRFPANQIGKWIGVEVPAPTCAAGLFRLPMLYKEKWQSSLEPWWCLGPGPLSSVELAALRRQTRDLPREQRRQTIRAARQKKQGTVASNATSLQGFRENIEPQVREAVLKIKQFGLDFMKQVASAHKIDFV